MKETDCKRLAVFLFACICGLQGYSQIVNRSPPKKLIDFGWNSPFTSDLRNNLKKYENGPFDGVTMKLPKNVGAGNIFMVKDLRGISNDTMEMEKKMLAAMPKSVVLTDNFIVIYGASQMNWFSDEDWAIADKQIRYAAQLAKASNCKGILWDPEAYKPGKNPWKYIEQDGIEKLTYQDYYNQVRKRGAQFIMALQEEFPGLVLLSLREFSDFQKGSPFSEPLLPVRDIRAAEIKLTSAWWGLHLPFTIGILDGINQDTKLVDANEEAYYYTSAFEFHELRNTLKNDARALVPTELHQKFATNYTIGHAISADYIAGNWADAISFPFRLKGQAKMLTSKEKALWFEHNAYHSLRTSDEYAWLYTEKSNWWSGENVPEGFAEALVRAKRKVANGEALGFVVEEMLKKARDKAEKFQPEIKK